MASRSTNESPTRPEPGQILIVIHDFSARSSDELSLRKGDRVELIERDDDFGDGWYLGRHLMNGNSGLFPEVYTRIAPRGQPSYPSNASTTPRPNPVAFDPPKTEPLKSQSNITGEESVETSSPTVLPQPAETDRTPQASRHVSSEISEPPSIISSFNAFNSAQEAEAEVPPASPTESTVTTPSEVQMQPKSLTTAVKSSSTHGQDSPVMNETLSVIDEHITDMNSPHHSVAGGDRRGANDSGSEYSSHVDHRLSYINGEETDEEEDRVHTRQEVENWTADQVSEYLFTAGVEAHHCEVFRDQEITGDVLLGMDQTSVLLKEFDLGTLGRRLKTWQKIKVLQDEVNGHGPINTNTTSYGSEVGSDDGSRNRSRSINSTTMLPRIPSMNERKGTFQQSRLSQQHVPRMEQTQNLPMMSQASQEAVRPAGEKRRPSAASIRDMHHSRQSSANEFGTGSLMGTMIGEGLGLGASLKAQDGTHKKQPSFDRNWTMGSAASPALPGRPLSSSGIKGLSRSATDQLSQVTSPNPTFDALDRGYFSGGEAEGRSRNVLRKRGSTTTTTHSRNSSYTDEQRLRSATANSRHSRFGSVDSMRDVAPTSAAAKYYGLTVNGRRRTPSETSITAPPRPLPPAKDLSSPAVTKLEGIPYESASPTKSSDTKQTKVDWLSPVKPASNRQFGLRAISDAITAPEKARVISPTESIPSSTKDSPLQSPSRTASSTPSGGPSFELDSPDSKNTTIMTTPGSARPTNKKKSKKETSAYTRGLEKKTPQEQMIGADYSGWMKKKSTNLMTTWKPRLFILKGRRLSYYYSEDDQEEKGLIDISFHRVLPADNDRLTGLHATLTGATHSPTSPSGAHTPTIAATEAAAEVGSSLSKGSDSMFIFKLVPPRAGLSKAVTFTKPTVHYFAVPNIKQGRLWMAALMKATIDRDETVTPKSTYQQKTISLAKARAMRHRPPALMNLEDKIDEEALKTPEDDKNGLKISGIAFDREPQEGDSGVSGVSKPDALQSAASRGTFLDTNGAEELPQPRTA